MLWKEIVLVIFLISQKNSGNGSSCDFISIQVSFIFFCSLFSLGSGYRIDRKSSPLIPTCENHLGAFLLFRAFVSVEMGKEIREASVIALLE